MKIVHTQTTSYDNGRSFSEPMSSEDEMPDLIVSSTPAIRTRKDSDGWRPMTNWSKSESVDGRGSPVIRLVGLGQVDARYGGYLVVRNVNTPVLAYTLPEWDSLPSQANVKNAAISKLKGQQLNVVMLLKDRRETLTGLHDRLKSLLSAVRHARRGDLVRSANTLRKWWRSRTPGVINKYRAVNDKIGKPLASMWLELQFLHMQVIADANGIIKELESDPQVGFLHGRSGLSESRVDHVRVGGYTWNPYGFLECDIKREHIVYAQISALPDLAFLTSASRLGVTNPLYVVWDSVPLSFVADWVLPVGQYLNGFDALLGMTFKGAHIGLLEKTTVMNAVTAPPPGYSLSGKYDIQVQVPKSFTRALTDQFPDMPELRNPLSGLAWKAATTAALLAGAVGQSQRKPR